MTLLPTVVAFGGPHASSWAQVGDLFVALGLSAMIGFERELKHKSAGLRTNTVIGVAAALIVQVSKFGFGDVVGSGVALDPSRVAAQIVTGIGFIGAGLIFVAGGDVRGLTTAATAWLTAAVGMACGAGLLAPAAIITAIHLVVVFVFSFVEHAALTDELRVRAGTRDAAAGADLAQRCRAGGMTVLAVDQAPDGRGGYAVTLRLSGRRSVDEVAALVPGTPAVESVLVDRDVDAGARE